MTITNIFEDKIEVVSLELRKKTALYLKKLYLQGKHDELNRLLDVCDAEEMQVLQLATRCINDNEAQEQYPYSNGKWCSRKASGLSRVYNFLAKEQESQQPVA